MQLINYNDLIARYGKRNAYVALTIIEDSAKVTKNNIVQFDFEKRLHSAFEAMRQTKMAA
jgi:hypothetical protein